MFAEASRILQEVQVSLLQISLCHVAGFFQALRTVQPFNCFYLFSIFLLDCDILTQEWDDWQKERFGEDFFFVGIFFVLDS